MKFSLRPLQNLTPSDRKLVVRISIFSTLATVAFILIFWIWQVLSLSMRSRPLMKSVSSSELLPIDIEAHRAMAHYYAQRNQPLRAITHLERIKKFLKNDCEFHAELGMCYLDAGFYEKSLAEFDQTGSCTIDSSLKAKVLSRKGMSLFYLGKTFDATTVLNECLAQYGNIPEAACNLGIIELISAPETKKAKHYFQQALLWDSTYVEAWYQLGRYTMDQQNYVEARSHLLRALQLDPLHTRSHARLGMIYYYLEEPLMAEKAYATALALNPEDFNTRYNLAELYYNLLDNKHEALKNYLLVLGLDPHHGPANFKAGLLCAQNNMLKEAVGYFETALNVSPSDLRAALQLAATFERLERDEKALQWYEYIIKKDELNLVARQKIRAIMVKKKNG